MRAIVDDFRDGIAAYSTALRLFRELGLWIYMIIPGIISLIYGVGLYMLGRGVARDIADWLIRINTIEAISDFVANAAIYLGWLCIVIVGLILYRYVILIVVAPFMSPLSERVEKHLRNDHSTVRVNLAEMVKDVVRGARIALRNIIRELFFTLLLFIMGFVPVIGILSGPAIFILQAYYAGFGNMDYTLERHMGVRRSVRFVRQYKGLAIANGSLFLLILAVPILGLFIAPGLATVAGVVVTIDRLDHSLSGE